MRWKSAILDWDGTLVDTKQAAYFSVCEVFRRYGCDPPPQPVYMEGIAEKHKAFYHEHGIPESVTRGEINKIFMSGMMENIHHIHLREYALDFLGACKAKGLTISIVSGASPAEYVEWGVEAMGIKSLVDYLRACAITKIPELREILHKFSVHPHYGFYVDDTFEGVSAANHVGMTSVAIEGGFNTRERILEANPDLLISSFCELTPSFLESGVIKMRASI